MSKAIVELLAVGIVGGASLLVTHFLQFKRLNANLSLSETKNMLIAIPIAVYLAYRIYFGISQSMASRIQNQYYSKLLCIYM
jgi:hypothetical protein